MFKKILFLVTPSGVCAQAADTAVALAAGSGARLYVLCVMHAAEHCWDALFETPAPEEAEARKSAVDAYFRQRLAQLAPAGPGQEPHCAVETTCGFTDVEAQRFAWRIGADLIVAGCDPDAPEAARDGRAGQRESIARLAQNARCPVLLVSGGHGAGAAADRAHFSRILAATDFSRASDHAIHYAALLARTLRSQLDVLHVVEGDRPLPPEALAQIERSLAARYAADAGPGGLARFAVAVGQPGETIVDHARAQGADLIVLAHRRLEHDPDRPDPGAVLSYVARNACCPTLSLNREFA